MENSDAAGEHRVPPDGCLDILYDRAGLRAIGTMTAEQRFRFPEGVCAVGVRFRPGMAGALIGTPADQLTNGAASLLDLWAGRARELQQRLDEAQSTQEAMRLLLASLPVPDAPNAVQRAIESIASANGNVDLDRVASEANLSPRQFRRRCLEESGLSPKRLSRVLRFRHACRLAAVVEKPNWCHVAHAAEYCDQAHLIRDFHSFTGRTPVSVFSNTRTPAAG